MKRFLSLLLFGLMAAALGAPVPKALAAAPSGSAAPAERSRGDFLQVSTFSTILSEVASRVGGDVVRVHGHIQPGADPHDFEPKPADLKKVAASDLVLLSAKHMEGYVGKIQEATGGKVRVLEVGAQIPSLFMEGNGGHGGHEGHSHAKKPGGAGGAAAEEDPHWWHSIQNMQRAARVVRDALVRLRPEAKAVFEKNADAYLAELGALQNWARSRVSELPRDKRKLVTSHDALQYFAKEYGFKVYHVEGLTPSEQPSSRQVSELLKVLREQKVKAVFSEDTVNPKVLRQITSETGAALGGQLWVDGLGTGEAATYDGMFRHNVNTIVDALK